VLVPIGGTEQNGPHMSLGKHNVRVKVLAGKIAAALGNALVAPVLAYAPEGGTDPPTSHMRFPGTITVSDASFEAVLESAGRSLKLAGFRDIVFLGDHGGYRKGLQAAAARLNVEWKASNVRAHAIVEYYAVTQGAFSQALKDRGHSDSEIGTHAGLGDTSLALAVDPRLVRSERLASGGKPAAADGVYGDPRRASAELGQIGVDLIVERTVDAIRKETARR
jgi:creatinine amidohydrolase